MADSLFIYAMVKSPTRATKFDAFRMKKYYLYYIKQNRVKGIEWLMKHSVAPLNYMFDDFSLYNSSWCHRKCNDEGKCDATSASTRDDKGYYRCKLADRQLYDKIVEKYSKYISLQFLMHCCHQYDTHLNEGTNRSVSKYVPKGTNFCTTTSLITCVYIAAGIQLVGNHIIWVECMRVLDLLVPVQTELYLLDLDQHELRNFCREHNFANIASKRRMSM